MTKRAAVTGASSGIGAAVVRQLEAAGWDVVGGARRSGDGVQALDVTDPASVAAFAAAVGPVDLLVANAGGALGTDRIADLDAGAEDRWRTMWETNVLGLARTVRAFWPALAEARGQVVVITSVAGHQAYPGGTGYTGAKHAAAVLADTLRLEGLGSGVRVTEIAPGMVETEFSVVRFGGDTAKADAVYTGMTPLTADDVADAVLWAATRPAHVQVARLDLFPTDQAGARDVHRA